MKKRISRATIERLPLYLRELELAEDDGETIISSETLGRRLGVTPVQIRKDLTAFGQFGRKGIGYSVPGLKRKIGDALGLDNRWRLAIVGVGHLGTALANYENLPALGFEISALFDVDERIIGSRVNGKKIYDFQKLRAVITRKDIDVGVITVPEFAAQTVANALVEAGIKGIWNFTRAKLEVPPEIPLVNENLAVGLSALSYGMTKRKEESKQRSEKF